MKIEEVRKLDPLERFTYWITERESIRLKKEAGEPKPWTDDHILQSFRFCNVVRMDDKVSQWLLKNWYEPYFDHPNIIPAVVLARHFNKPSSLEAIGFPVVWQPKRIKETLRKMKLSGPVFNGAYVVTGGGIVEYEDKIELVIDHTVQPLVDTPIVVDRCSMENTWKALREYKGMGSFMAGQIVADMRWALSGTWDDALVWAPCGPGSIRGMNRVHGRELNKRTPQVEFTKELHELILKGMELLPESITNRMEAIDWQNCLCEFDKMCRTLDGEGKPKQLYKGV